MYDYTGLAVNLLFADKPFYRHPSYLEANSPDFLESAAQVAKGYLSNQGYTGAFLNSDSGFNLAFYTHQLYFSSEQ